MYLALAGQAACTCEMAYQTCQSHCKGGKRGVVSLMVHASTQARTHARAHAANQKWSQIHCAARPVMHSPKHVDPQSKAERRQYGLKGVVLHDGTAVHGSPYIGNSV